MRVRAPGKLILLGEYAVLHGGPTLVVGVDRFAECIVDTFEGVRIGSPLHGTITLPQPQNDSTALPFASALINQHFEHQLSSGQLAGDYCIDSQDFYGRAQSGQAIKLGLGSSAASTTALAGMIATRLGQNIERAERSIYRWVQDSHRAVQGLGSGADVAASTFGGSLAYVWSDGDQSVLFDEVSAKFEAIEDTNASWHIETNTGRATFTRLEDLGPLVTVWTGKAADTRELVRATQEFAQSNRSRYRDFMGVLAETAKQGISAWSHSDRDRLMESIVIGADGLRALGEASGVPLVTPVHNHLERVSSRFGAVAKPTGAGGGDLAWVLGPKGMKTAELKAKLTEAGMDVLCLGISQRGVHLES